MITLQPVRFPRPVAIPRWEDDYADIGERIQRCGYLDTEDIWVPHSDDSWKAFCGSHGTDGFDLSWRELLEREGRAGREATARAQREANAQRETNARRAREQQEAWEAQQRERRQQKQTEADREWERYRAVVMAEQRRAQSGMIGREREYAPVQALIAAAGLSGEALRLRTQWITLLVARYGLEQATKWVAQADAGSAVQKTAA